MCDSPRVLIADGWCVLLLDKSPSLLYATFVPLSLSVHSATQAAPKATEGGGEEKPWSFGLLGPVLTEQSQGLGFKTSSCQ